MNIGLIPCAPSAAQWRQIATTTATLIAALSIGTAVAAIADAEPRNPAQANYVSCVDGGIKAAQQNSPNGYVSYLTLKGIEFDCCIGGGQHWVGGEWNDSKAHCEDSDGNILDTQAPPPPPPPGATLIPHPGGPPQSVQTQ
jgi:hypothetical protein